MTKYIYILFFCMCLASCSSEKKEKIPVSILPKEKMIAVITDLHIAEAAINLNLVAPDSLDNIYGKNKITKAQYDSSFKYYAMNPAQLVEIYDAVLNDISKKQAEAANYKSVIPVKSKIDSVSKEVSPKGFKKLMRKHSVK